MAPPSPALGPHELTRPHLICLRPLLPRCRGPTCPAPSTSALRSFSTSASRGRVVSASPVSRAKEVPVRRAPSFSASSSRARIESAPCDWSPGIAREHSQRTSNQTDPWWESHLADFHLGQVPAHRARGECCLPALSPSTAALTRSPPRSSTMPSSCTCQMLLVGVGNARADGPVGSLSGAGGAGLRAAFGLAEAGLKVRSPSFPPGHSTLRDSRLLIQTRTL